MELVFASGNPHKLKEIQPLFPKSWMLQTLHDFQLVADWKEEAFTLEENSLEKAKWVHERVRKNCFAEDTGLEVDALGGSPGVHSARFAGLGRPAEEHMALLLKLMEGNDRRQARFRTVFTLIFQGMTFQFQGRVEGHISLKPKGDAGFGYDPVFIPYGSSQTFAEMNLAEKSAYSHRARGLEKLILFLTKKTSAQHW